MELIAFCLKNSRNANYQNKKEKLYMHIYITKLYIYIPQKSILYTTTVLVGSGCSDKIS